ncbi:MAG: OxyL-like protein [Candidatus Amesbacteria bacterium GW2011_GWA2_47_70]|uniref:OxyL-like protein n=1 Tax=Candidatus Amesbacteria bacterium GW2011_GWC2_45_19 TaxID=1618366 RepID=A0A0G1M3W7_9BACT|nr:MAG: OxyL-like protein [Candidatus Amesbacteria bacterium GW2011_GWC2_45_19]KKU38381.1 MAG: OxyL-like protein [Candidatus Amesbacteria bacterium GW2011_GWA1_46_35]KKU68777.1 MAG: OxyL-like protein [Microgenomates group bacterium GW2011_GWC1_47_20]KKU80096.1 MAG: OxyL-like protein [Candidatus Amesbacteria bacterium GW2011_GWA2_47_70]
MSNVDVLVAGAGLSGLTLAREMESGGVNYRLVDTRKGPQDFKRAMYLISSVIARQLSLGETCVEGEKPIVGYREYDAATGRMVDGLGPILSGEIGFTPVSQYRIEKSLRSGEIGRNISWGTTVEGLVDSGSGVEVTTNRGNIRAKLVVDATGHSAAVTKMAGKREGDYLIRALRGGSYPVTGHDPRVIHFVSGLERNEGNWMVPLGESGAEVMAGQVMPVSGAREWWDKYGQGALENLVGWYEKKLGISISLPGNGGENMAFRVDPAPASQFKGGVVPFGEAAGLNSPIHGQLIDVLPLYAKTLADEIVRAKERGEWMNVGKGFYRKFLTAPPFLYLIHRGFLENRIRGGSRTGGVNRFIYKILREEFDDFSLWRILQEGGLKLEDVVRLSIRRPREMTGFIVGSTPVLAHLLVTRPDLYVQFVASMPGRIASLAKDRLGSSAV